MQRLTEQMLRHWGGELEGRAFSPAVDIYEDADAIYLKAELPGIKPDDVNIDIENHVLTIRGERKLERDEKREGYRRIESSYGSFTRSFALPESVVADKVDAEIEDGVLKLRIPKQAEATAAQRIPVKGRTKGAEPRTIVAKGEGEAKERVDETAPSGSQKT
jgi:HSP20 family protein